MTQRPLKTIVLGPLPPPYGGPEVMTRTLIDALKTRREIEFVHLNTQVSRSLAEKGGQHQFRKALGALLHLARLIRLILRLQPDVVYLPLTNSPSFLGFLRDAAMILVARAMRCRVAIRLHGGYYFYAHTTRLRRKFVESVLGRVDLAMVQGDRLKSEFCGTVPDHRIAVVPNGIDDRDFALARARRGN